MSCRIDRLLGGKHEIILHVSGRIHAEQVDMLKELAEREEGRVVIDLREVCLVDRDSVRLLAAIQEKGIELRNPPAYIREWVSRERTLGLRDTSAEG
jgi:anti-anti-sigma regulatory factor